MTEHQFTSNGMGYFWCSCDGHQAHVLWSLNEHVVEIAAAAVDAERERVLAEVEALHKPFPICDDCDHDHTDEDVQEGRAFDTGYSYTCEAAALYIACRTCCCVDDPDEQSENCVTYHEHTMNPDDRCPTAALVARLRGQA